ncbi:MAG: pathogenicity protein [Xanthomonadaceae bacterium]|nr:pathogenicity protein [Xanthomonadaceae bacterium]
MKRRWLHWTFGTVGGILLLLVLGVLWLLNTQTGTRAALNVAQNVMGGKLEIATSEGTIAGPLTLSGVRYVDPASGLDVALKRVHLDPALLELFGMRVHVVNAEVQGVSVMLGESAEPKTEQEPSEPFTLQAPIDLVVERFMLSDAVVSRAEAELVRVESAEFVGSWVDKNIAVERLEVTSPDGEIEFRGTLREAQTYVGDGSGRFRWRVGESTYAGTLQANAQGHDAGLNIVLTAPLGATLNVALEQSDALPWKFVLGVPSFDPRDELMPDSSLESLAADVRGEGTLERGVASGEIVINGEPLRIERIAFERAEEALDVMLQMLVGGGTLQAESTVRLAAEPVAAKADARWSDIAIPAQWVGQVLHTEGALAFEGSADSYRATGDLRVGPPDRLAEIELALKGSSSSVQLEQFDLVQRDGRLAASGTVELEPQIGWSLTATATRFDPGHFATAWPGNLNFELTTSGAIEEGGPRAELLLRNLGGKLRGRAVSGRADVKLAADKNLFGEAELRSGASRLRLDAKLGDVTDAIARIEIPSLDDWVPNAGGALHGTFSALGQWPDITIDGQARATDLSFGEMRAEVLQLNLDVSNPTEPDGYVELRMRDASASGLKIERLRTSASGNTEAHSLELVLEGAPLGAELSLDGSLSDTGWIGTVEQLVLDIQDAARLALQAPVQIEHSKERTRVSEACFADGDIRLCLDGAMQADGSLDARYSLANVPLALANAFASADSTLAFDGMLRGEGNVQRNAAGELRGAARIESDRAEIARTISDSDETQVLLSITDLSIAADLDVDRAQGTIDARLNDTGSLQGQVSLAGLSAPSMQLDGSLSAALPSIAVVELFAPQLANVAGAVDLRADIAGTSDDPQVTGELNVTDLAADIPEFGLQLRNGRFAATPRADRAFEIDGSIESGKGQLTFEGLARLDGPSALSVDGKRFLALDMPGARVVIEPALEIEHVSERVTIKGEVTIPEATINVQELPGGGVSGAKASSDVVIIDAETQEQAEAQQLPIYADVRVILGDDDVELSGFGLVSNIEGQLAVRERPGVPTTGSGEIRVGGTYKAYGQDLTIEQGSLLFANTPLDNPNLRIVATRQVGEVTAGLRITGEAQNPVLTVFSNPEMGQADALSYLVAGKPLDQIGQNEGEGDALQTAARSLGTAAGGLLAKNLGRRFGVDEIGIKDNEMIGGSAFTIGQYLSPRLFLSYGVGLFEPGEVVTLRYRLTEALGVQIESGTEESRAGLQFRIER